MDPTMITPSRIIQSKNIQPQIDSWSQVKYIKGHPSTIILKASMKDHITSNFQSLKKILGEISHMCMFKTSISSRIQNFLEVFSLYGQIQGRVVVGTKNGDNLGGSSYLCPFKLIGLAYTWFIWYIFKYWERSFSTHGSHFISCFLLKDIPTIHKYHRSLTGLPYRSMDGSSFTKLTIYYLIVSGVTQGNHLYFSRWYLMCVPHLSFYPALLHY